MKPAKNLILEPSHIKISKTKKLLHLLSDGDVHSGVSLGKALGVTRSAVWKLVKQLKEEMGIEIEAKTNQGYRLAEKIQLLDLQQIKAQLSHRYHPYLDKCLIFDEIPSTSSFLLEQLQLKNDDVYICLAEMQTAGRGRFNRPWLSSFGNNIYLSLLWHFSIDITQLSGLSLAIGVSIVRALKKYGIKQHIAIKWPNDLFWEGRKLVGILVDLRGESNGSCSAVIGMGLNLYMRESFRKALDFKAVDLTEITQCTPQKNKLIGFLLEELLDSLAIFQEQGLQPFLQDFKAFDWTLDKPVEIILAGNTFRGIGRGVNDQGYFLLEDQEGKILRFSCGEASLRV